MAFELHKRRGRPKLHGVNDFMRAYFHFKSGDWPGNEPFPLASWAASEMARMPTYYVMELGQDMAQTVGR